MTFLKTCLVLAARRERMWLRHLALALCCVAIAANAPAASERAGEIVRAGGNAEIQSVGE